jgi:hypothetical protein
LPYGKSKVYLFIFVNTGADSLDWTAAPRSFGSDEPEEFSKEKDAEIGMIDLLEMGHGITAVPTLWRPDPEGTAPHCEKGKNVDNG